MERSQHANWRERGVGTYANDRISPEGFTSTRPQRLKFDNSDALDLLSSPSRNHLPAELSITSFQIQEQFREKIETKLQKLFNDYSDWKSACWQGGPARDGLELILLDFRKLREGIIASQRTDLFAISVYQDSVRYAVHARNRNELSSALPKLVFELHIRDLGDDHDLASGIEQLSLDVKINEDRRGLYASLLLLNQISYPQVKGSNEYQSLLRKLTIPSDSIHEQKFPVLSTSHRYLVWSKLAYRTIHSRNATRLGTLIFSTSDGGDALQKMVLRNALESAQEWAWQSSKVAYYFLHKNDLAKMLLLKLDFQEASVSPQNLMKFLQSRKFPESEMEQDLIIFRRPAKKIAK